MMRVLFCLLIPVAVFAFDTSDMVDHIRYRTERDKVISQNIANLDTPQYTPQEVPNPWEAKRNDLQLKTTHVAHFQLQNEKTTIDGEIVEIKPNGNSVDSDYEITKKSENAAMTHQMLNIYNKSMGMLRTATVGSK